MSILAHAIWPEIQPYIDIQVYGRDGGPDNPRHRIDVKTPRNGILLRKFLAVEMPCVVCGRVIHPIRSRAEQTGLYYAATCEQDVTFSCSRSAKAREEYDKVKAAMTGWHDPDPQQPSLL